MDLADYQAERPFLVGIDSDKCVFDSMELKHNDCFIPQFINHYGLQGVSKHARKAAEFVNLYATSRGVNRFPGLVEQLDINPGHEETSWRRLVEEGIDRFLAGAFAGGYQGQLLDEFNGLLPEHPPWNVN